MEAVINSQQAGFAVYCNWVWNDLAHDVAAHGFIWMAQTGFTSLRHSHAVQQVATSTDRTRNCEHERARVQSQAHWATRTLPLY